MSYNFVPTVATGDLWSAASHNAYIRDNFRQGVPGLMGQKGDMVVGEDAQAAVRLAKGADYRKLEALSTATAGLNWSQYTPGVVAHNHSGQTRLAEPHPDGRAY